MNREKIISLAQDHGCHSLRLGYGDCRVPQFFSLDGLVKFYHAAIANFLEESGQYITNDASREAVIKQAKVEAFEAVIDVVLYKNYDNDPYILAEKIREMAKEMKC